ncbi:hypothetical protein PMI09_02797 [Rhizobium sp. CF122]|uniref:hypothetical protein n=1 Tax=Rhizobium sp. CF122 TaxID=1144312 RepID=UPI000271CAEE|nr:hypothetical protein [Rhizobium sp. CF122]EJL53932.1 hypothetical protein PMI09_02797 [Rhizobium sp. CF122]
MLEEQAKSAHPMDDIILSVEGALFDRRGSKPLPDALSLRDDLQLMIDGALRWYEIFKAFDPKQPIASRRKDAERVIKTIDALLNQNAFPEVMTTGLVSELRTARAVLKGKTMRNTARASHAKAFRTKAVRAKTVLAKNARKKVQLGRETSVQWLIGEHLAGVYEEIFGQSTGNQRDTPYIAFVQAVFRYAGMVPFSPETVFLYRKQGIRRRRRPIANSESCALK